MVLLGGGSPLHAKYGTDARVQTLLLGAALGLASVHGLLPSPNRRWVAWAGWLGAGYYAVAFATYHDPNRFNSRGGLTLVGIAGIMLIFGVIGAPSDPLARALSTRVPVAIGRISYGLYLWHFPVFLAVTPAQTGLTIWDAGLSFWPLLAVRFVVTFVIALASFMFIERPALRLKARFERRDDRPGSPMVLAPG